MILQQLYIDSDAIQGSDKTPPMYRRQAVRWVVDITRDGKLKGVTRLGEKFGTLQLLPYNYGRSSDIVPSLLADTADYALGANAVPEDEKAGKKHAAFRTMLSECAQTVDVPQIQAIIRFLEAGGVSLEESKQHGIQSKERVAFTVEGDWPSDLKEVKAYWNALTIRECKGNPKRQGICLITGQIGFVESVLPGEIRIGKESAPIISINDKAAYSYGLEQGYNGAVSRDAAEGFTKALDKLMHDEHSRFRMILNRDASDKIVYVFWAKQGQDEDIYSSISEPDAGLVDRLIKSAVTGERVADAVVDAEQFFALAMTGNKTRVVFRDWLSTTLPQVKGHLKQWFLSQRIVEANGETHYYSVRQMAGSLYRRDSKGKLLEKITPRVLSALLRSALHGEAIPREVLSRVVVRCRADRRVSATRASLIKTTITLNNEEDAKHMAVLDEKNNDPPYVCGRLLALLDNIQYQAQGSVNNNIIDRYFSAATASPARILPILVKKSESAHLPKIRRQKGGGIFKILRDELEGIHALLPVSSYPSNLTLEQQACFLLGFYHQKAHRNKPTSKPEPPEETGSHD